MASLSETGTERRRLGGGRLASIVLLYACLLGLSLLTWFTARRAAETASWVDHTKTVLAEIDASLGSVVRDTAIVRGYLLTGDSAFIETFDPTGSDVLAHLRRLAALTSDNPSQKAPLAELRALSTARIAELNASIRARKEGGLAAALAFACAGAARPASPRT